MRDGGWSRWSAPSCRGGVTIEADALAWLAGVLGGDRGVTRRELEKLILSWPMRGEHT